MIVKDEHVKPRIGFIGMGRMGSHMALRLLGARYSLSVYDRAGAKTQPIAHRGARSAEKNTSGALKVWNQSLSK
jgi:3-hydroxyisobutyrate dehydrogenase-like beta-hydroxyacid dehydrogenase